ncbi:hypothetical protein [Magnetospirillum fulvum]|uniref:hypothetical protein n=1 Tax=Magnetospirillum fulvum TaxID=1082 RepID=UPI00147C0592|nr:hypothetical protein [Magnetospirillum fulvum]
MDVDAARLDIDVRSSTGGYEFRQRLFPFHHGVGFRFQPRPQSGKDLFADAFVELFPE